MIFFHSMDEHRPRTLKDFLNEKISSSCSSNDGFKSLPRKPSTTSMRTLIETDLNSNSNSGNSNPGIWSRSRLSKSAFQTVLNAVKAIPFFSAVKKSPPVGISTNKGMVKIKDVMRWKMCRDPVAVVAEEPPSPAAAAAAASCSSNGWGYWSESDLSSCSWECDSAVEGAGNDVVADLEFSLFSFSPLSGEDYGGATEMAMANVGKKVLISQEEEQRSPISVLQAREVEFSPFDQSLANNERRNQTFMQDIQKIESLEKLDPANLEQCISSEDSTSSYGEYDNGDDNDYEDKEDWDEKNARELLHCLKATGSVQSSKANLDKLLLDIFRDELNARRNQTRNCDDFELDILRIEEDWIDGSFAYYDNEHDDKDAYIKGMEWRGRWGRFEEEQEELALEIEATILHGLVGELLGLDD